ncbi:MAG: NAD(P)/FAD-dependent oxidoreductase [Pseudomonadota bacterium]
MDFRYDAIVVGARVAGASTAMLMARGGMRVLLVDWAEAGSDTMSTHALMRGATMQLARWGLLDNLLATGTPEVTKTTFWYGDAHFEVPIRPAHGTNGLIAPRRHLLDRTLVEAAREAGVDVRFQTAFKDVIRNDAGRVVGATIAEGGVTRQVFADLVVGADGRRSTVARRVKAAAHTVAGNTIACVYGYFEGPVNDGYRWYYQPDCAAGAIPTNDGAHCIFAGARPGAMAVMLQEKGAQGTLEALCRASRPGLEDELAQPVSRPVVFRGEPGYFRKSAGAGWALVGDAGYFKDPLTAHGITDALRDAEILARAALDGGDAALKAYEFTRDGLAQDLFDVTDEIAAFSMSMNELMAAHVRLNKIMKAEQDWMVEAFAPVPEAA